MQNELRESAQGGEIDGGEDPESYERAEEGTRPMTGFLLLIEGPQPEETIRDTVHGRSDHT